MLPFIALSIFAVSAQTPAYKDPSVPIERRIDDLLPRMTMEEKLNQLRCDPTLWDKCIDTTGFGETLDILNPLGSSESARMANQIQARSKKSRLGIPLIIHSEALHGLIANGTTSYPQAIGLAATWDPNMMSQAATCIAEETRARGIRHVLSPVINVIRDARWGRVEETYGEDPLLTSRMGVAFVKAFESHHVATTPKHYVDNAGDAGMDSHSIQISERELREVYLPPFEAVVKEGGASTIMSAYNALNGRSCSANHWLLTDLLRNEWGFDGWVASDYGAVDGAWHLLGNTGNAADTAAAVINAGLESEWPNVYIFGSGLDDAVKNGLIKPSRIDEAVRRVLRVKFRLGVFDEPLGDPDHADQIVQSQAHRDVALNAAREAMTLLKNDGTLPLHKENIHSIAVIGATANGPMPLGGYSGSNIPTVSVVDGIKAKVGPGIQVNWARGSSIGDNTLPNIPASALHDVKGEYWANQDFTGDAAITRPDAQIDFNWDSGSPDHAIPHEHFSARWTGTITAPATGDYQISVKADDGDRLWLDGQKVIDDWSDHPARSTVAKVHLTVGQPVAFRLDYYQAGGDASVQLGWAPVGAVNPDLTEAVDLLKNSDVGIVVCGIVEGEGQDRASLDLPGNQEELIHKLAETGKPMVIVLIAGAPVTMGRWIDQAPAILDAWYPGQEGGTAIADTLFGDNNPGGRLPITFPKAVGQCPIYYNMEPSGRGYDYVDLTGKPQFAFGYGLSYTKFEYSNLHVSTPHSKGTDPVSVTFDVQNVGDVKGDDVPQLYFHQVVASFVRPLKELGDFQRITLAPGEKKTVTLTLKPGQLVIWNDRMRKVIEPGQFDVMVGESAEDIRLKGRFIEP